MKRKMFFVCAVVIAAISFISLSAFTSPSSTTAATVEETHTNATGRHCSGTVGCDCPGFAPITNGKVWQQAYCKHCGHKKSCHK